MTKKTLNQNAKYVHKLINVIEPDFVFSDKPINRLKDAQNSNGENIFNKTIELSKLKEKINSIQNCNLKESSKNILLGNGKFAAIKKAGQYIA